MPNIAQVLKEEISRVARKENRGQTEPLKKAVATHRSDIAALKRRVYELERLIAKLVRGTSKAPTGPGHEEAATALRFSATRLAAQRKRLGLSAAQMGQLIGVSGQSVYKWETGATRPRRSQLEAIARTRGMGKKAALAALEAAEPGV